MKIIVTSRLLFDEYLKRKGVTDENVEEQDKIFFISINNQDDKKPPFFSSNKKNVLNMTFADLEEDAELTILGENRKELFKAMTREQAAELYQFIKANKDKEAVMIHCTMGVARSGAVGAFINDFTGGSYEEFKRDNPAVQPNPHVYRLLHDEWYKDIAYNDSVTGKPIEENNLFRMDSESTKRLIKLWTEPGVQNELKERLDGGKFKPLIQDEIGQTETMKDYRKNDNKLVGVRFIHPDGSSTYVKGHDPFYDDPEFENFWLETDKYYGMVTKEDLDVIGHLHHLVEILPARKKTLEPGEFEPFAQFGFGPEYGGIDLRTWITLKNMIHFFKWFGSGTILTDEYCNNNSGKFGENGSYFQIPFDKEFKHLDVLSCGNKDAVEIIVTDVPVEHVVRKVVGGKLEYWLHTVQIFTNEPGRFMPKKYLVPGTRFYKI